MHLAMSTTVPSTVSVAPPKTLSCKPVAVTITSAAISSPETRRRPAAVKHSICPVTMLALPPRTALKMSASGAMHKRWSHGL